MSKCPGLEKSSTRLKHRGFTLIELLLAVAIFALVGMVAATTLSAILDGRDNYLKKSTQLDRVELVFTLLAKDFAQLASHNLRDRQGDSLDAPWQYSEEDQRLEWLSHNIWTKEVNPQSPSFNRVIWSWKENTLTRSAVALRNPAKQDIKAEPLLDADQVRWQFYHDNAWQNYPPLAGQLPRAVSMTLQVEGLGTVTRSFLLPEIAPVQLSNFSTAQGGGSS